MGSYRWGRLGLLALLLAMTVAISGCFGGGGGGTIPTGAIEGRILAPNLDIKGAQLVMKSLIVDPQEPKDLLPVKGARVTVTGATKTSVTFLIILA